MGVMQIMDRELGDEVVEWDKDNEEQVSKARQKFDEAVKKGYTAYKAIEEKVIKRGEIIKEFDPTAQRIVLAAPLVGG